MSNFALISIIALWICVIGLTVIVAALVRQVGVLSERVSPAGALAIKSNLKVGDQAPVLAAPDAQSGQAVSVGGARDDHKSTLIFWVSPECPMCKKLLPVFRSAAKAESKWLQAVLATDADADLAKRFQTEQQLTDFPLLNSRELGLAYGVSKLPYAALVDSQGKVTALGLVNTREHFDSLFNAQEAEVASIQDYLSRNKDQIVRQSDESL
ncbi:MAG: redoxin family protein [Pseudomonadota bacterium]